MQMDSFCIFLPDFDFLFCTDIQVHLINVIFLYRGIMAKKLDDVPLVQGPPFSEHNFHHCSEMNLGR